jgi:hypothetical protein
MPSSLPALWWLQALVLPLGGLPAGLLAVLLLRGRRRALRPRARLLPLLGALAAWPLLVLPAGGALLLNLEAWLGPQPLRRLPWLLALVLAASVLAGALGTWPFLARTLRREGRPRPGREGLALALLAWAGGLVPVVVAFLLLGRSSLLGLREGGALPEGVAVYALDGDALLRRDAHGPRVLRRGLAVDGDTRVACVPGTRRLALARQGRLEPLDLELPEGAQVPGLPPAVRWEAGRWRLEPRGLREAWGAPASLEGVGNPAWEARLGAFPSEGLTLASRDLGGARRMALELPGAAWSFRCGTWLPGAKLLVQAGPQLLVIDAPSGQAVLLGRGQGPLAVLEGPHP